MKTRVLTAISLLAALGSALFLLPAPVWWIVVALLVVLLGYEWGKLCRLPSGQAIVLGAALAGCSAGLWAGVRVGVPVLSHWYLLLGFGGSVVFWILIAPGWTRDVCSRTGPRMLLGASVAVVPAAALAMVWLSPGQLIGVLGLTWVADSLAYFVGRGFGRHRMAPRISPGKTWEGFGGGMAGVLAYAIIVKIVCGEQSCWSAGISWGSVEWALYLMAAMLLGALSVLGDLFESALKRRAGVKDSGTWLPGHGGALDRADSALAVLPTAAMLVWVAGTTFGP